MILYNAVVLGIGFTGREITEHPDDIADAAPHEPDRGYDPDHTADDQSGDEIPDPPPVIRPGGDQVPDQDPDKTQQETVNKDICPQLVFVNGSLNAPRVQ